MKKISKDIPPNLKNFNTLFLDLAQEGYKHDIADLFSDFLSSLIAFFSFDSQTLARFKNKYTFEEQKKMQLIINEFLQVHYNEHQYNENLFLWNDFLGTYYEILSSNYKRKSLSQFFTPECLCDLLSEISIVKNPDESKIITINDPACGSGRLLLSAHCHLKGKCIVFAEDLDEICVKMTVINMLIHGVEGEVIHHNSFIPTSFFSGYYVNEHIKNFLYPSIRILKNSNESNICQKWEKLKEGDNKKYNKALHKHKETIKISPHFNQQEFDFNF